MDIDDGSVVRNEEVESGKMGCGAAWGIAVGGFSIVLLVGIISYVIGRRKERG